MTQSMIFHLVKEKPRKKNYVYNLVIGILNHCDVLKLFCILQMSMLFFYFKKMTNFRNKIQYVSCHRSNADRNKTS